MFARTKSMALILAASALLVFAGPAAPVRAADACQSAGPLSFSTFSNALSALVSKVSGSGAQRPSYIPGSVWNALNGKQQDEVLNELSKELSGIRASYASEREAAAAQEKLANLKRRIWVRDKLERDDLVRSGRVYDTTKGGKKVPYTRDPKPLSQIIDEETKKAEPGLGAKYGKKYADAIRSAVEQDPKKFAETLGNLAGGDYTAVLDQAADWGASAFGTIVSDALGEMGYPDSKVVWDEAVKRAGTAKTVFQALARGDHDAAWNTIKDEYKKEVKDRSRAALGGVINWVMDTGGGPPSAFGLTPGDAYLKLIDAEIAAIEWSKDYIRKHSPISDGECIRRYKDAYAKFGNVNDAYDSIDVCLVTSRYSAFFEFGNQARSIGLDETAAIKAFLEANRTGQTYASTPLEWIGKLVEKRQKEMQAKMVPELSRVEQVMANVAEAVGRATENRLSELAAAKLNERQWDQLEQEIRDLEQRLDAVLAEVQTDLDRIRKNSDAVQAACNDYEAQKKTARDLLQESTDLSVTSSSLWDRLRNIDTSVCKADQPDQASADKLAKEAEAKGRISALSPQIDAAVTKVCAAPEAIRNAADKEAARAILDAALETGREVERLAADLRQAAADLAALGQDAGVQAAAARAKQRQDVLDQLDALAGEIDALANRFEALKARFDAVYQQMNRARQRVEALVPVTSELNQKVRACLRPLADAPVADEPRRLLEELGERSGSDEYCRQEVSRSWYERDPDPSAVNGIVRSTPWGRRNVELSFTPARLREKLAELRGQCPPEENVAAQGTQDAEAIAKDALTDADLGLGFMQRCVAEALTAFNDTWLKPKPEPAEASCSPDENATTRARLQKAVSDGIEGATAQLEAFDNVAAQVRTAHAKYDAAKGSYASGDLGGAESELRQALANAQGAGGACSDLISKINSGLDKISRLTDAIAASDRAVAACDRDAMNGWKSKLGGVSNPAAKSAVRRIDGADEKCAEKDRERQVAESNSRCVASFGQFSVAEPSTAASDKPSCICVDGYQWNDDRSLCVKGPSKEEIAAARNANCREKFGAGYYAGPADKSGQYYCLPTKATANAWCRENNNNNYYAGKIKSNGGFNCYLSESAQRQAANDDCRRRYGSRLIRVVKRGGTYYCEYRTGTAGGGQPRHDPNSSAAAAVIQGIIGGINKNRQPSGGRSCHHRPTDSTQHCSSN